MLLSRESGETELDFHKRLIYGKLEDKTLADMDYSELSELVYGQVYSSDVARRMMYGSKKTLDLLSEEVMNSISASDGSGVLSVIEADRLALRKEKQRFSDQKREFNKLVMADSRREHLEEELIRAAQALPETVGSMKYAESDGEAYEDTEAVLVLCDWHYGMVANNVWNTYNTEICRSRVEQVVSAAVEKIMLHRCRKLHVVVLGDLIHGAIHTSARVASEELVCEQLMNVSEILAQSVEWLSRFVEQTEVYMTYGNHARTVQNKADNIHRDNMERIIPWWLQQRLSGRDDIVVHEEFEDEFIFLDPCGFGICAAHGDLDGVRTSPRLLTMLYQKKYGLDIGCVLLADKHHRESFEELGVSAMICGALCGTDEYASNKRLYSTPEQMLLVVDEKHGIDAEYHIKC